MRSPGHSDCSSSGGSAAEAGNETVVQGAMQVVTQTKGRGGPCQLRSTHDETDEVRDHAIGANATEMCPSILRGIWGVELTAGGCRVAGQNLRSVTVLRAQVSGVESTVTGDGGTPGAVILRLTDGSKGIFRISLNGA